MGADLIGYMFIGPTRIPDASVTAAKKRAREAVQAAMDWDAANTLGDDFDIPSFWADHGIDEQWMVDHLMLLSQKETDAMVDHIVEFWNDPCANDVALRWISDASKVIFAGEMTWGDSPSGEGFETFRSMIELGISATLGVF